MTKKNETVADRLRKLAGEIQPFTRGCTVLAEIGGYECSKHSDCNDCTIATLRAIADMVEAEQAERQLFENDNMPIDTDGQPCFLDDAVWYKGRKHLVVAVSHKGHVNIRDWEKRDCGNGAVWVKADLVTHREPDTQEAIDNDATISPQAYYRKYIGSEAVVMDEAELTEAMCKHLLARQRKLMGGE